MVHNDDTPAWLVERRERVFLVLASIFICSMTMLNIIGITRFVQLGPMALAVGVLPYPLTFLCTDLICELYGQKRANFMVTVGLFLNLFIFAVMTLGNVLPAADTAPPWQAIMLANEVGLPNGEVLKDSAELFTMLYACTSGAMFASMMAYIAAQYCDVKLFHFWKNLTKGKHLWLRNNFSTMISQLVDSITVIGVTFWAAITSGDLTLKALFVLLMSNYFFKVFSALLDTPFFYFFTFKLRAYLQFEPAENAYK